MSNSTIIPCLRYRDCLKAIDWLCRVFGFERQAVYADGDIVHHAQLTLGGGMVMLGGMNDGAWGKFVKQPDEMDGFETQSPCIVVADANIVYDRVKEAGGEIVIDIKDESYGGRGFACRDPEGRLWYVGTYDPWKTP